MVRKYGKENFKRDIIETNISKSKSNEREHYWIKNLKSYDRSIGYNLRCVGLNKKKQGEKYMFLMENKHDFKEFCDLNGDNMTDVLNDFIKKYVEENKIT